MWSKPNRHQNTGTSSVMLLFQARTPMRTQVSPLTTRLTLQSLALISKTCSRTSKICYRTRKVPITCPITTTAVTRSKRMQNRSQWPFKNFKIELSCLKMASRMRSKSSSHSVNNWTMCKVLTLWATNFKRTWTSLSRLSRWSTSCNSWRTTKETFWSETHRS